MTHQRSFPTREVAIFALGLGEIKLFLDHGIYPEMVRTVTSIDSLHPYFKRDYHVAKAAVASQEITYWSLTAVYREGGIGFNFGYFTGMKKCESSGCLHLVHKLDGYCKQCWDRINAPVSPSPPLPRVAPHRGIKQQVRQLLPFK